MNTGFILIHRKLLGWEWYSDINTKVLFLHLLLKANHKPQKWQGIEVLRGQVVTGRKVLAKETGLSEQQVRTCLDRLKSTNEITIKSTSRYSIITLNNYNQYQGGQPTKQPTDNQQSTTNNNDNNVKNNPSISPLEKTSKSGRAGEEKIFKDYKPVTQDDFFKYPVDEFFNKYNEICKKLPKMTSKTITRQKKVIERLRENPELNYWGKVFSKANDVCLNSGWKPSFDWLVENDTNYIKVIEGTYETNSNKTVMSTEPKRIYNKASEVNYD